MWNIYDRDKRKWQCFVCGVEFETYDEFKEHIFTNHEEGREYIKCPLHRCAAPVRDVRAHFKSKHPNETLPKNCQLRASIWRDFRGGKKKTNKPNFKNGYFTSIKNNNQKFYYRSGYELDTYEMLEELNECVAWHGESFKVPYFFNGSEHQYTPDLSVKFQDGHVEIWEIKPTTQTGLPKNKAKWAAAEAYCKARGWDFKVIPEKEIEKLKLKVRRQDLP